MATKKQKRERGIAKREQEERERRERGLHYLKLAQNERLREKEKAAEARKQRAISKSKRLAKAHKREKQGVQQFKPAPKPLGSIVTPPLQRAEYDSGL